MKFLIEFTQKNLAKFRSFIRQCNKTFSKSGIIMTISKDSKIRVAPDPFSISDKFQQDYFETKVIEIYKYFVFIDYHLIPDKHPIKNSTYHSMDLKVTEKYNNHNNNILIQENDYLNKCIIVTFRISREELNKLNDLLHTNFLTSEQLTIKATAKPDFMNIEESKNYSNAFLSIFDKPSNALKSGILFKPLKVPLTIRDYEEYDNEVKDDSIDKEGTFNQLGDFLFGSQVKSKILKKYCTMSNKNFNKNLIIFNFKQRDLESKADKNNLIISCLNNSFYLGYYFRFNLSNEEINNSSNLEQFKNIYKITINSEILLKMLKNFKNDKDNPDYLCIWSKALVMKTNYYMNNSFDENENNNKNNINIFGNDEEENTHEQEQEEEEPNMCYMTLKTIIYYSKSPEIIDDYEKDNENNMSIKQYVLKLINNNIDDKHEELNKSMELNYDENKDSDAYREDEDNLFFEEEESNDKSRNEDNNEEEKKKLKKKKNKKKGKTKKKNKEEK